MPIEFNPLDERARRHGRAHSSLKPSGQPIATVFGCAGVGACLGMIAAIATTVTGPATAATAADRYRYEVTTETGMPNLDENLRYATRTEERCIDRRDLSREFWMLEDIALQDCRLVREEGKDTGSALYRLHCSGGHGTTGQAHWQQDGSGSGPLAGTLNVRLGGKNMTFYQRVTARPIGLCKPEP